jgi:hypothetical protein
VDEFELGFVFADGDCADEDAVDVDIEDFCHPPLPSFRRTR